MENGGTWSKTHLRKGPMKIACGNQGAQLATNHLEEVTCDRCRASKVFKARLKMKTRGARAVNG